MRISPYLTEPLPFPTITTVKQCLNEGVIGSIVHIVGRARFVRTHGETLCFVDLTDGSCIRTLQVVLKSGSCWADVRVGYGLEVTGTLVVPARPSSSCRVELLASDIKTYPTDDSSPMAKAALTPEFLRTVPHLRTMNRTQFCHMKVRHSLERLIRVFMEERGLHQTYAPLLTSVNCEEGDMFKVVTTGGEFFDKDVYLSGSGQMHLECDSQVFTSGSYTFGTTCRAEKSNTQRHLSEFTMLEVEKHTKSLQDIIQFVYQLFVRCLEGVHVECAHELEFMGISEKLASHMNSCNVVTYNEAVTLLLEDEDAPPHSDDFCWGSDLNSVQEKWLVAHYGGPTFVIQYPKSLKSFYMLETPSCEDFRQTVECMDFLVPGVGELVGGSMRTADYDTLREEMVMRRMRVEDYQWYLDIRRYGALPTAGFGIGFERLCQFVLGGVNIKDTIQFPRTHGTIIG